VGRSASVGPLHRGPRRRSAARQQIGSALAAHDAVGDLVCVALVCVAGLADPALEVHPGALLHDVRGLVRRGVQIWGARERDVVAGSERPRAHRGGACGSVRIGVGLDIIDALASEGALDHICKRQTRRAPRGAPLGGGVHGIRGPCWARVGRAGLALDQERYRAAGLQLRGQLLCQGTLSRTGCIVVATLERVVEQAARTRLTLLIAAAHPSPWSLWTW
jgi:hypothetical protein